jgi:signal transduction histidine kinase
MLAGGALWGLAAPAVEWGVAAARADAWVVAALTVRGLGWMLLVSTLALVFPDGRLPGPRWRWVAVVAAASLAAFTVGSLTQPHPIDVRIEALANPLGVGGAAAEGLFLLGFLLALVAAGAGLVAMWLRWRRAGPLQREQIGWFVLACLIVPVVMIIGLFDVAEALAYPLAVVALPLAIGFAVLQGRLYGLDTILRRTFLYVVLSTAVLAVYLLAVAGAGSMIGIRQGWWLGLVGAGAVAVAVEPMRRTLQRGANRLVYGDWEDPYEVGRRLGLRLSDAAAPQSTLDAALAELAGALRLRWVAIDGEGERIAEVGRRPDDAEPVQLPLDHDSVLSAVAGRRLRPRDRALLESVARQIAPVVRARRLTAELRRSRDRLVVAQQEERRRLRRDLHDGLGATLAALAFKVDTARNVLVATPSAEPLLLEIRDRLRHTVDDVRRLVDGLRPPHLDELGLGGALTRLVGELPGPTEIRIRIDGIPAVATMTEVAAYRIAQEALTNVVRHAGARSCDVVLACRDATLELTVADDGNGAPAARDGNGLATMRERAEELGGTLAVTSEPGRGTIVTAVLPRS